MWDEELCIQCGKCVMVCPHSVIRAKIYDPSAINHAPEGFQTAVPKWREFSELKYTLQVAPEDCTGCGLCVAVCPAKSKSEAKHRAINMEPQPALREKYNQYWDYFLSIPELSREKLSHGQVKDQQLLQPLFEFSGACAGCGETPYISLMTRLFGDRALIAQRHRLLVDLRRQPADHALHRELRRTRSGLVELAVRRQRRVRHGHAAGHRQAERVRQGTGGALASTIGDELAVEILERRSVHRGRHLRAARPREGAEGEAGEQQVAGGPRPAGGCRRTGQEERVDHRRRWLGLRHRLSAASITCWPPAPT